MRFYLAFALCLCFLLAGCSGKRAENIEPHADLLLLHTNDTHSYLAGLDAHGRVCLDDAPCFGGYARIAYAINDAKKRGENVLALDAGDMFQGTLFYSQNKWPILAKIRELLPYDAQTLGNHEWDEGCGELAKFLNAKHHFPMLCANLSPRKGCPLLGSDTAPYHIFRIGGHQVAVIGLANDGVQGLSAACRWTFFDDRVESVQRAVAALEKQGVQRIILLTHIGLSDDIRLAQRVNGVDVIVGGHSHSYLGSDSTEGPYPIVLKTPKGEPVLVVTAKWATQYLGELACFFDAQGVLTHWHGRLRLLRPEEPRDPAVSAFVARYAQPLQSFLDKSIGYQEWNMGDDGHDICVKKECLSATIMADAMLAYGKQYDATLSLFNSGGVRAALPRGRISMGDILNAFPFGNTIEVREYRGEDILKALEWGVREEKASGSAMLQTAGLRYQVIASNPPGKRVLDATLLLPNGSEEPLRKKSRYRVVLSNYLAQGGDHFRMLVKGKSLVHKKPKDVDVLANYLGIHNPLPKPRMGRLIQKNVP